MVRSAEEHAKKGIEGDLTAFRVFCRKAEPHLSAKCLGRSEREKKQCKHQKDEPWSNHLSDEHPKTATSLVTMDQTGKQKAKPERPLTEQAGETIVCKELMDGKRSHLYDGWLRKNLRSDAIAAFMSLWPSMSR